MAVIHPEDRVGHIQRDRAPLHPALGLVVGFGFIIGIATAVHVIFSVLV
jgi:hypothetical protein